MSRGLLPFDHDRDGDLDLLITTIDGSGPSLPQRRRATRLRGSRSARSNRRSAARRSAPRSRRSRAIDAGCATRSPSGGYLTSGHGWIHLGLGSTRSVERFEVRWPDGATEVVPGADAGRRRSSCAAARAGEGAVKLTAGATLVAFLAARHARGRARGRGYAPFPRYRTSPAPSPAWRRRSPASTARSSRRPTTARPGAVTA